MRNKKKIFGIITCSNDYDQNLKLNIEIYKKIYKKYKNFCILNLVDFRIFYKNKNVKEKKKFFFSKNIKVYKPKNLKELTKIFYGKTFIGFNNLGKTFSFFKIYFYLNFIDLRQILLSNIGYPQNKVEINYKKPSSAFFSSIYYLNKKISYYIFRLLTIFGIFPKISLYFETSKKGVRKLNSGLSRKIENLFPFTKLSYFRKIYLINSRSFNLTKNKNLENKYICFIDSNFVTLDRLKREGSITINTKKMYYLYLKKLLNFLGKILKKKIVICIHPKNNDKLFYKYFKNFKIKKYATSKIISKSYLVLFHESSAVMDAVILKKKILSLKSPLLGNYLSNRTKRYSDLLGLSSIELSDSYKLDKIKLLNKIVKSSTKTKNYINNNLIVDGNKFGEDKIIEVINKNFF